MADYDTDASAAEFMLQHLSLEEVLSFVIARDEVRRIRVPLVERESLADPCTTQTMRAVDEAPGVFVRARAQVVEAEPSSVVFDLVRPCVRPS